MSFSSISPKINLFNFQGQTKLWKHFIEKKNEVFYQKKSGIWKKSVNVKKISKEMSKSGKCFY